MKDPRKKRRSGVTLAEALIMIMVAGTLMVPVVGTMHQGITNTQSFELRAAMMNFAESKMAQISYVGSYQGETPVNHIETIPYPNASEPQFLFDMQVEVVMAATLTGQNSVIDGAQHPDLCAVSVAVGLRNSGVDNVPDVATVSLMTMVCPPPPPPDMVFVAHPSTRVISVINPINHELIDEWTLEDGDVPLHLAVHPNGRWLAVKCPGKIRMLNIDQSNPDYSKSVTVYSLANICGSSVAETGDGNNGTRNDRGMVFRPDGKFLYFTHDSTPKVIVVSVPSSFSVGSPGSWVVATSFTLPSADAKDLRLGDDGILIACSGGASSNRILRINTHTNTEVVTYAGGSHPSNFLQVAAASAWGGNEIYLRMGGSNINSFLSPAQTSFASGTISSSFTGVDTAQHGLLVSNDNRFLISAHGADSGASAKRFQVFSLPLNNASLQTTAKSKLVDRGPSGGAGDWTITQLEYSPFREELIAKTSDNMLLFPNMQALTSGAYADLNAVKPAVLTLNSAASDVKGRIAEYVWMVCYEASGRKFECFDLYGGTDSNGIIISDNAVSVGPAISYGLSASGDNAFLGLASAGSRPKSFNTSTKSIEEFPNTMNFPATSQHNKGTYLLDGSLLVSTTYSLSSQIVGNFFPGVGLTGTSLTVNNLDNGVILYEVDYANGFPKSDPCLGFVVPGLSLGGFVVSDVEPMHRRSGAYVLMGQAGGNGAILLWIEKSREPGYNTQTATESYRIMGYWSSTHDGFPGRGAVQMALSADDSILAIYDVHGNGSRQTINFYDMNNLHFPTSAGLAYTRYKTTGYDPADGSELSNNYFKDPYTTDLPFKPGNSLTASTSLAMTPNRFPAQFNYDASSNDDIFYGISGHMYHGPASYMTILAHDGARFAQDGHYNSQLYRSGTRNAWAEDGGDNTFTFNFNPSLPNNPATRTTPVHFDFFSNDDGLGAYAGFFNSSADVTGITSAAAYHTKVASMPEQMFRPFKFRPPLMKELILNGQNYDVGATPPQYPNRVSGMAFESILCFSRDSAFPTLFFVDRITKILHSYSPFSNNIVLFDGTATQPLRIDLTPTGVTTINDMAVSPDGRRLLIGATDGTAGAIFTMKLDYVPAIPGRILVSATDHTLLTKRSVEKPVAFLLTRPFSTFTSVRDSFVDAATLVSAAPPAGFGSHRAAVASGGIYYFGGAPGTEADPTSSAIYRYDSKGKGNTVSGFTLPKHLRDFTAFPWEDDQIMLIGGVAPGDENSSSVSIFDTASFTYRNARFDSLRPNDDSERTSIFQHAAAITPFGPVVVGGIKGAANTTYEFNSSTGWDAVANQKNTDATVIAPALQLGAGGGSHGSYFMTRQFNISANTSFYTKFTTVLKGKDGVTFCVQNDPRGVAAIGDNNLELGYAGANRVLSSLAVWIDTKLNGSEPAADFVTVTTNGNARTDWTQPDYFTTFGAGELGSNVGAAAVNAYWWVMYDGVRDRLNVWYNNSNDPETSKWLIKDFPADLAALVGGAGNSAYFGFTGASNDGTGSIKVQDWYLKVWEKANPLQTNHFTHDSFAALPANISARSSTSVNSSKLRLTDSSAGTRGAAWYNTPLDLNTLDSFSTEFALCMWSLGNNGMAMVVHGQGNALMPPDTASNLGYGGIGNSIVVEFDTGVSGGWDADSNHVAIIKNADPEASHIRSFTPASDMNDTSNRYNWVWVEYDHPANNLRVYMTQTASNAEPGKPAQPLLNHIFNQSLDAIVGTNATIGFTARAGDTAQEHYVAMWRLWSSTKSASFGGITNEVKAYNPNAISGHVPTVGSDLVAVNHATIESDHLKLVSAAGSQKGAVWLKDPVTIMATSSFSTHFVVQITDFSSPPADGLCFIVQGNGNTALTNDVGIGVGYKGIANSFAVELDNWVNTFDVSANCMAILQNGLHDDSGELAEVDLPTSLVNLSDSTDKYVWVDFDGPTRVIKGYISKYPVKPAAPTITGTLPVNFTTKLGGTSAWFGFGSATGASYSVPRIKKWDLEVDGTTRMMFPLKGQTVGMQSLPAPVMNGTAVTHYSRKDGRYNLYCVGAGTALGAQLNNLIYKYDFAVATWSAIDLSHATNKINIDFSASSAAGSVNRRTQVGACSWGEEIFIFGGYYSNTTTNSATAIAFNPDTNSYRLIANMPAVRNEVSAVPYGPYIFLFGGSTTYNGITGATNTIWRYKP